MPSQNSNKKLNSYTSEFKESSVELVLQTDQRVFHTAKNLGINVNTLHDGLIDIRNKHRPLEALLPKER